MAKKTRQTKKIINRRAHFDYELGDSLSVGLELTGPEVRNLRLGHGQLRGAYVAVINNQLWLLNAQITGSPSAPIGTDDQRRTRRLLAKRREIDRLEASKKQGMTIIPMELITSGRYLKLKIALGKGRKRYDKREVIKKREQERSARYA